MTRLLPVPPSPIAMRLHIAATLLLLLQLAFVLNAPAVGGGLRLMTGIVGMVATLAFAAALIVRDPGITPVAEHRP